MTKVHTLRTLVLFVSCLLLASSAFAFAGMSATFDTATWDVDKANGSILTVKGPAGIHVRQAFGAGETPTFSIWDKAGNALPDGQYNWELSLSAAKRVRGEDVAGPRAESFSGTFRINSGSLLVPKASSIDSDSANKDQVILDDLIVDGSACIGFDCVNGESFGFDTIRIKENNLRIRAQDTSSSASFPTNDWQITFNDSSNGGANKFAIDDIDGGRTPFTIEAGAPSHSLYVDDAGRIGLGTSTPVVELHIKNGDSPTLRLEQDGSSGFTPQTWDVAGNETNFFVRDATNGSRLPFKIRPSAPTDSLYINTNGDIGFGTASPAFDLHVRRTDDDSTFVQVENTNATTQNVGFNFTSSGTNGASWNAFSNTNGTFVIATSNVSGSQIEVDNATGGVSILNGLTITGGCTGCDAVFTPEWALESIEEHAESMWTNSYLPGVGPTPEGTVAIDVFEKTTGILQELEKAHIYIEQLHQRLVDLESRLDAQD